MRVLVAVPSFPSLNQPWIDTYLESLMREGVDFLVFSAKEDGSAYQEKVDQLGLLQFTASYSNERAVWLRALTYFLLVSPIQTLKLLRACAREVRECPVSRRRKLKAILRSAYLASLVRLAGDFDVFHGHFEDSAFEFLLAGKVLGTPMVMTFHGLPPKGVPQPAKWRRPYLYRHLSKVFVNTRYARAAVEDLGCSRELIAVIPQGLPLEDFAYAPQPPPAVGEKLRLVSIGRFHRDKGQGRAILAARRLADAGIKFSWTFIGVGPAAEIDRLKGYIRRLALGDNVHLEVAAPAEMVRAKLAAAHLFVLSSLDQGPGVHVETQGVVVQEAQASGCIPIVTSVGGVPECVRDGVDAIVVRPGSSRAISEAVVDLLSRPREWRLMMENGRTHVETRFSADTIGEKIVLQLRLAVETG